MEDQNLEIFSALSRYQDKGEILKDILVQLEKDTGLDYTHTKVEADNPVYLETLRKDLAYHIQKLAGMNQTRFMHLIYRVDISQAKLNRLEMDEHYYHKLAEMVLSRMFQKIVTRKMFS